MYQLSNTHRRVESTCLAHSKFIIKKPNLPQEYIFFLRIMDLWLSGREPLLLFLSKPLRRAYLQNYAVCPSIDMIT